MFVHAHPDDEAIFTAATMHSLARAGARVVLVTATAGELGEPLVDLPAGVSVGAQRLAELERSAEALGVARLVLLGRRDSGCPGWPANAHPNALLRADLGTLTRTLADLVIAEQAEAVVGYDAAGIYGHPDHVVVHHLADTAALLAGAVSYQATVARDVLRRHGTHLVLGAAPATAAVDVGVESADVVTTVTASAADVAAKRAAMAAHASQIRSTHLSEAAFAAVYGAEWYLRRGPAGVLEELVNVSPLAA